MFIDAHAHLDDPVLAPRESEVLAAAKAAGVGAIVNASSDLPSSEASVALAARHPEVYAVVGVHPHEAKTYTAEVEKRLISLAKAPKVVAFGEIGLDYHYDLSPRDVQKQVFDEQLEMAFRLNKPVVLHIREAHGDATDMLTARWKAGRLPRGVMHCYTGSWESAKQYLAMGLYISFSGAVTFKNAPKLAEVAVNTPAERLLIETDCPYMAPVPLRGRRNEPAFITHTFEKVAGLRGEDPEALAEQLWQNSCRALQIDL